MAKIERVKDGQDTLMPLRITRRKARQRGVRTRTAPIVRVKCGCCPQAVEICHDEQPTGNTHHDTLEVSGVSGTIHQWRQVLLPLLGMAVPPEDPAE